MSSNFVPIRCNEPVLLTPHQERSMLIVGAAVSWAMTVRKGAPVSEIRRWEDLLLKAVEDWQKKGMEELLNDPVVSANRENYERTQAALAEAKKREASKARKVLKTVKARNARKKGKKRGRLR